MSEVWDMLNSHSRKLNSHSRMLDSHSIRMNDFDERMNHFYEKYRIVKENEIKWYLCYRHEDYLIFTNGIQKTVKIHEKIVSTVTKGHSLPGEIKDDGDNIIFNYKEITAKIPKSLLLSLSKNDIKLPKLSDSNE